MEQLPDPKTTKKEQHKIRNPSLLSADAGPRWYFSNREVPIGVTIWRDWVHEQNLTGGQEQYIPKRLLFGVLPSALLDAFEFWQDEDDNLRGYSKQHVVFVTLGRFDCEATRTQKQVCARILRRALEDVRNEHEPVEVGGSL